MEKQQARILQQSLRNILLLDLGLPDIDGIDLLRLVRQKQFPTQVLILTARDSTTAKVAGLDAGADDYLTKPFGVDELLARCVYLSDGWVMRRLR